MNADILGIDLGTTKSAIAIWDATLGEARVLPNAEGQPTTPSVVGFDPERNEFVVGQAAVDRMVEHPDQVAYVVKRFIGRTFRDDTVSIDRDSVSYAIEEAQGLKVLVKLGNRLFTPPQISAEVL